VAELDLAQLGRKQQRDKRNRRPPRLPISDLEAQNQALVAPTRLSFPGRSTLVPFGFHRDAAFKCRFNARRRENGWASQTKSRLSTADLHLRQSRLPHQAPPLQRQSCRSGNNGDHESVRWPRGANCLRRRNGVDQSRADCRSSADNVRKQIQVGSTVVARLHDGRVVVAKVTRIIDSVAGGKAHIRFGAVTLIVEETQIVKAVA
jgi:hypothetical protein